MRITIEAYTTPISGTALLNPVAKSFASGGASGGGGSPTDFATMIALLTNIDATLTAMLPLIQDLDTLANNAAGHHFESYLASIDGHTASIDSKV